MKNKIETRYKGFKVSIQKPSKYYTFAVLDRMGGAIVYLFIMRYYHGIVRNSFKELYRLFPI